MQRASGQVEITPTDMQPREAGFPAHNRARLRLQQVEGAQVSNRLPFLHAWCRDPHCNLAQHSTASHAPTEGPGHSGGMPPDQLHIPGRVLHSPHPPIARTGVRSLSPTEDPHPKRHLCPLLSPTVAPARLQPEVYLAPVLPAPLPAGPTPPLPPRREELGRPLHGAPWGLLQLFMDDLAYCTLISYCPVPSLRFCKRGSAAPALYSLSNSAKNVWPWGETFSRTKPRQALRCE
mmetsp:Transcript_16881/g.30191  ORF Transcript_16881/g.30191 Transcript_16881/m.30191 type:complete len:234 (-) Transcript_16881:103-804(-)